MGNRLIFLLLPLCRLDDGVTQKDRSRGDWKCHAADRDGSCRQIRRFIQRWEMWGSALFGASQL